MTITREQAAKVNPNRSSRIVAGILNEAIEAGLVVDPRGRMGGVVYVPAPVRERMLDFARESGDADASWATIIDTLLRIADAHALLLQKHPDGTVSSADPVRAMTRSEVLTAQHANDPEIVEELDQGVAWVGDALGWRRDGLDDRIELDAEIDRTRDEKIDTLITSLAALRELVAGQRDRIEDVRRSGDEKLATSEAAIGKRLLALEKGSVFAAARNDSGWVI